MKHGGKGNRFQREQQMKRQREAQLRNRVSHGGGTATLDRPNKIVVNFPKNCCSACANHPFVTPQNQAAHRAWHQQKGS